MAEDWKEVYAEITISSQMLGMYDPIDWGAIARGEVTFVPTPLLEEDEIDD